MNTTLLLFWATYPLFAMALIGYDCGQKFANFTTISLNDIGECDIPNPEINSKKASISLVQINDFTSVRVRYCKIEISRTVQFCGMHSHVSAVKNGKIKYLRDVTRDECMRMHVHRSITLYQNIVQNLKINDTVSHPMTFAGTLKSDGTCIETKHYADPYGEYSDVIVHGYITIRLEERYNSLILDANKIKLETGTTCTFTEDHCIDSTLGYAFWDTMPVHDCIAERYTDLYTGNATKIIDRESERAMFVVEANGVSFAFKHKGLAPTCGYNLIRTEHPKLFIIEHPQESEFRLVKEKNVHNNDIFAYVNSKFVFVEHHFKGQIENLYHKILVQQCELERKILQNSLSLAFIAPDLMAYQLMSGPGYISLLAGEVLHILKCVQVEVRTRETKDCYQELPVYWEDKELFMAPRTHILKEFGTKTICDNAIPVMYLLSSKWYKLLPTITSQDAPEMLKPKTKQTWTYTSTMDLATSGIYTYSDIEKLKTFIMFPNERSAVLNDLAMGFAGKESISKKMSVGNMFDENTISRIAESTWNRMYEKFITFGSASAAFITIIIIFKSLKFIIDTMIQGYALHSIYGFSVHILGAIWNSITQLLLHLAKPPPQSKNNVPKEDETEKEHNKKPAASAPVEQAKFKRYDIESVFEPNTERVSYKIIDHKLYPQLQEPVIPSLPHRNKRPREDDC